MNFGSLKSLKSYINEEELNEVLITFGNRPNFGQVVLLAGGAGSGKGFMTKKLLGIDAKWFDVDEIKGKIIHPGTPKLNKKILDLYGVDVTKMNLRNPDEVALLHKINDEMGISKKVQKQFFDNLPKRADKLPNVVFDTTMKSIKKIRDITEVVMAAGYRKENIHIVWIMNDAEMARKQNKATPRVVPEDILMDTHVGVAETMQKLMRGQEFQQYIDGYVYVAFNKEGLDNSLIFSEFGGSFVDHALIIEIKRRGKKTMSYSDMGRNFLAKIKSYVPKEAKKLWDK